MPQGRIYTASFTAIAVTAVQDLFELTAPSSGIAIVHSVRIGQYSDAGDAEAELKPINLVRYAASGSGGSAVTPTPHQVGHAASGVSCERNNTTQGTTPTVVFSDVFNIRAGWLYVPTPEERFVIPPSGIFAVELPVAPSDSLTMAGSITFEEID